MRAVATTLAVVCLFRVARYGTANAQQPQGKAEREIWALIQATDTANPKTTDSVIFVSGAYPRPIIGRGSLVIAPPKPPRKRQRSARK